MTKNISPLRYPGGKTRACKILEQIILDHFDITQFDTLISPFFGGGSFEFHIQNNYNYKLIVNEIGKHFYNCEMRMSYKDFILVEDCIRKVLQGEQDERKTD